MSKLTLSVNPKVVEEAKHYARISGKSLSRIVEEYLKSLTKPQELSKEKETSKLVRELRGSVKINAEHADYKTLLSDILLEKYLK